MRSMLRVIRDPARTEQLTSPNNNTPVKTGVLWGCIHGVGGRVLRADTAPFVDHAEQVEHVRIAVVIDVARADAHGCVHGIQVGGIDRAVTVEITLVDAVGDVVLAAVLDEHARDVVFAGTADGAVFENDPAQIDLFSTQTLGDGPRDVGGIARYIGIVTEAAADEVWVALVGVDPAALFGRVACDRAAADGGVAARAVDPAAIPCSALVAIERTLGDSGAAVVVAVNPAAAASLVADQAAGDGGAAGGAVDPAATPQIYIVACDRAAADGGVAVLAVNPAASAVVSRVVRDRTFGDSGAAVDAVDSAAVRLRSGSSGHGQIPDHGSGCFAAVEYEYTATLPIDGHIQIATGTTDGDGLAVGVQVVFVVGAGRDVDHVAIDRCTDRRRNGGLVTGHVDRGGDGGGCSNERQ